MPRIITISELSCIEARGRWRASRFPRWWSGRLSWPRADRHDVMDAMGRSVWIWLYYGWVRDSEYNSKWWHQLVSNIWHEILEQSVPLYIHMCNISSSKHSAYSGLNKYLCFLAKKLQMHTFTSNHNVNKRLCGLCFWAPDILIDIF